MLPSGFFDYPQTRLEIPSGLQLEPNNTLYELFTFRTIGVPLRNGGLTERDELATGSSVGAKWSYQLYQTSYNATTDERYLTFALSTNYASDPIPAGGVDADTTVIFVSGDHTMEVHFHGLPAKAMTANKTMTVLTGTKPILPLPI